MSGWSDGLFVVGLALAAPLLVLGPRGTLRAALRLWAPRPGEGVSDAVAACVATAHGAVAGGALASLVAVVHGCCTGDLQHAEGYGAVLGLSLGAAALVVSLRVAHLPRGPATVTPPSASGLALGALLALASTFGPYALEGGHVDALLQPHLALATFGPAVAAMVAVGGGRGLGGAVIAVVAGRSPHQLATASATWLAGAVGAMIGGTSSALHATASLLLHAPPDGELLPTVQVACAGPVYAVIGATSAALLASSLARRASSEAGEALVGLTVPLTLTTAVLSTSAMLVAAAWVP